LQFSCHSSCLRSEVVVLAFKSSQLSLLVQAPNFHVIDCSFGNVLFGIVGVFNALYKRVN